MVGLYRVSYEKAYHGMHLMPRQPFNSRFTGTRYQHPSWNIRNLVISKILNISKLNIFQAYTLCLSNYSLSKCHLLIAKQNSLTLNIFLQFEYLVDHYFALCIEIHEDKAQEQQTRFLYFLRSLNWGYLNAKLRVEEHL